MGWWEAFPYPAGIAADKKDVTVRHAKGKGYEMINKPVFSERTVRTKEQFLEAEQNRIRKAVTKNVEKQYKRRFKRHQISALHKYQKSEQYGIDLAEAFKASVELARLETPEGLDAEYRKYVQQFAVQEKQRKEEYGRKLEAYNTYQEIWSQIEKELDALSLTDVLEKDYQNYLDEARKEIREELSNGNPEAFDSSMELWSLEEVGSLQELRYFAVRYRENIDPLYGDESNYTSEEFDRLRSEYVKKTDRMTGLLPTMQQDMRNDVYEYFGNSYDHYWGDKWFGDCLTDEFTEEIIMGLLRHNPHIKKLAEYEAQKRKHLKQIGQAILTQIPENFIDLFPAARKMHRKFILHIGPTNSGKTHDALHEMMSAPNGVYLAPLRLLAYECYEKLNSAGVPCRMLTGEEELDVEGAMHVASTIEMADLSRHYAVAVIDEAQMVGDEFRGGAWTAAILGLQADVIHVCMAEYAREIVGQLIDSCGDTYTVVEHHRDTPLEPDYQKFSFPQNVQKGDAMIVFSRRNVFRCAAEAQDADLKCSVVYGALPYDARRNEVDRFLRGETDVVIATDAIGMGMNLPIRRVVFLEAQKFDGKRERELKPEEVQQIAGRAGRKGLYERGSYTAEFGAKEIRKLLEKTVPPIQEAVIRFPKAIIGIDGKLSSIIEQWMALPEKPGYKKADSTRELELAKELEPISEDKGLIYRFVSLTFDEKNDEVHSVWRQLFSIETQAIKVTSLLNRFGVSTHKISDEEELMGQETQYKKCDLLFQYAKGFGHPEAAKEIMEMKAWISDNIKEFLSHQKFKARKCKYCGRTLKWNYPYGMCSKCHDRMYPARRAYWDDDDDFDIY